MAKRKATTAARPPGIAQRIGPRSGFVKAIVSVEPAQIQALRAGALRRAQEAGSIRPDSSALAREALAAWLNTSERGDA